MNILALPSDKILSKCLLTHVRCGNGKANIQKKPPNYIKMPEEL